MRGCPASAVLVATIVALSGCSADHSDTAADQLIDDRPNCAIGSQVVGTERSTLIAMSDQLNAIAPAAERGDVAEVRNRLAEAKRSSASLEAALSGAAGRMTDSPVRNEFNTAASAGGHLSDVLSGFAAAIDNGRADQELATELKRSVENFNASVQRLMLVCANYFGAATVDPTTPRPAPTARR